jgi:hypothetical protein
VATDKQIENHFLAFMPAICLFLIPNCTDHPGLPGVMRRFETALLYPRIHGISYWESCYLYALPPAITNRYLILREGVHQLQRPGAGRYRSRVSRKCIVGTPAGV